MIHFILLKEADRLLRILPQRIADDDGRKRIGLRQLFLKYIKIRMQHR